MDPPTYNQWDDNPQINDPSNMYHPTYNQWGDNQPIFDPLKMEPPTFDPWGTNPSTYDTWGSGNEEWGSGDDVTDHEYPPYGGEWGSGDDVTHEYTSGGEEIITFGTENDDSSHTDNFFEDIAQIFKGE